MLSKYNKILLLIFCVVLLGCLGVATPVVSQNPLKNKEEDPEKQVRRDYRGKNNQSNTGSNKTTTAASESTPSTSKNRVKPNKDLLGQSSQLLITESVGITLWRLIEKKAKGEPTKGLRYNPTNVGGTKMFAERVNLETGLAIGDKVRFTVEVPFSAFIYIVDRERVIQSGETKLGPPTLIFPNPEIRDGQNKVSKCLLTGIPSDTLPVPFFDVEAFNEDGSKLVGDLITIVISKKQIEILQGKKENYEIPSEAFEELEAKLKETTKRVEPVNINRQGKLYTKAEKDAELGEPTKGLRYSGDPLPNDVYKVTYNSNSKFGFAISFSLKVCE